MPPNVVVLSATSAIGGFLAGILFGRHNRQRLLKRLLKKNYKLLTKDQRQVLTALAENGHASLFKQWPRPGIRDQEKRTFITSAVQYVQDTGPTLDRQRRAILLEPKTVQKPKTLIANGDTRVDQFYWLRDDSRADPEVLTHLKEENAYTEAVLESTEALQEALYKELRSSIQEADQTAPQRHGPYFYYNRTEEGKQYKVHCRRALPGSLARNKPSEKDKLEESVPEQVLLDENEEAKRHSFYIVRGLEVSPNHQLLGYGVDTVGGEKYVLHFKDIKTGKSVLAKPIPDTAGSFVWANDNQTIFYVTKDELDRPFKVWKHKLGQAGDDELVYHEEDEAFYVHVSRSRSDQLLLIASGSAITSEVRWLCADDPDGKWQVAIPRVQDVEYELYHWEDYAFILRRDKEKFNSEVLVAPLSNLQAGTVVIPHNPDIKLESLAVSKDYLTVFSRWQGIQRPTFYAITQAAGSPPTIFDSTTIAFEEAAYTLECGHQSNSKLSLVLVHGSFWEGDFDSSILRYVYSSLTTPPTVYDLNMRTSARVVKKVTPVLGGFKSSNYCTERQWATSDDGTRVPISLVYHKNTPLDGTAPCLLYGYGSYEVSVDPDFDRRQLPLLDRGFVYAIAHIRGGGEMGRQWYEDGKFLKKMNTFRDFISCAKYLISNNYTNERVLCIEGRSAGGLLIGATLNLAPELFCAAIAGVPFVDCLTTMLDPTIPLTIIEYDEWGNPAEKDYYDYIKSYSPVDNVRRTGYPNLLVTAGLHDPRVGYWEPAKWVAKLRALKTNDDLLLFKCEMGAGHFSKSGRFERLREQALEQAFLLYCIGRTGAKRLQDA